MLSKGIRATVGAVGLIALLVLGIVTTATAGTTSGGTIHIYSNQANDTNGGATGPIVITGAIGDYGTATSIDENGTVNANGNYEKIVLKKGTFEINSVSFNKATNKVQPTINTSNCSISGTATGPVTLFDGNGAYAGIKGTVNVVLTFAGILPTLKNGKCNGNAQPVGIYGTITGTGTVSF